MPELNRMVGHAHHQDVDRVRDRLCHSDCCQPCRPRRISEFLELFVAPVKKWQFYHDNGLQPAAVHHLLFSFD